MPRRLFHANTWYASHLALPPTGSRATAMCLLPQQPLFDHVQVRGQTVSANYGLGIRKRKQVEVMLPFYRNVAVA